MNCAGPGQSALTEMLDRARELAKNARTETITANLLLHKTPSSSNHCAAASDETPLTAANLNLPPAHTPNEAALHDEQAPARPNVQSNWLPERAAWRQSS